MRQFLSLRLLGKFAEKSTGLQTEGAEHRENLQSTGQAKPSGQNSDVPAAARQRWEIELSIGSTKGFVCRGGII